MTTQPPRPDALRYVQCELPEIVEQLLISFEDEISVDFQDFDNRMDDFIKNVLPGLSAALDAQAQVRDQIIAGSPVQELGSMAAMEESLGFVSPKKTVSDLLALRIDERKLGAVGIVCINGRIWKKLSGVDGNDNGRLDTFRYLWNAVNGDYDAWVAFGDSIAFSNDGDFLCLENYIFDTSLPYTQRPFTQLPKQASQYRYNLLWTTKVSPTTSNSLKLKTLGFNDTQILNIFNGLDPQDPINKDKRLANIQLSVRKLTKLLLSSSGSLERTPNWMNEYKLITEAIVKYLTFRYDSAFKSVTFDPFYWQQVKADLSESELKELFENRLEVHDMLVPTTDVDLEPLFNVAFAIPSGSNVFHTYQMALPKKNDYEELESTLWNLGLLIFKKLAGQTNTPTYAAALSDLQLLLQELVGDEKSYSLLTQILGTVGPPSANQIAGLLVGEFNDVGYPTGKLVSDFNKDANNSGDPDLVNTAVKADSLLENAKTGNKPSAGLPTQDSGGGLLSRTLKPLKQFVECNVVYQDKKSNLEGNIADSTPPPVSVSELNDRTADPDLNPGELYANRIKEQTSIQNQRYFVRANVNQTTHRLEIPNHGYGGRAEIYFNLDTPAAGDFLPQPLEAGKKYYVVAPDKDSFAVAKDLLGAPFVFPRKGTGKFTSYTMLVANKASSRRQVTRVESTPRARRDFRFDSVCRPKFDNAFTRVLNQIEGQFRAFVIKMCNILKQVLASLQDKIDLLIAKLQVILDASLARLERLLTFDLNIGGKLGIESSLIQCSWGLDFNLNLDLFGRLLTLLNEFIAEFSKPLRNALGFMNELVSKFICIPVQMIQALLGTVNSLLNQIGCSLKDVNLPAEIFDLLQNLLFTFDLRGLVVRKGYEAYNGLTAKLRTHPNNFKGLAQFGSLCHTPTVSKSVSSLQEALKLVLGAPTRSSDRIQGSIDGLLVETLGGAL